MQKVILIVEDDDLLRELLKIVLNEEGYLVEVCANGKIATEAILKKKAADALPSMIILDLNMPVMTGWEVSEWLSQDPALAEIPVIVTSATREQGEAATKLHADAYLVKPYSTDEILTVVALFSLIL